MTTWTASHASPDSSPATTPQPRSTTCLSRSINIGGEFFAIDDLCTHDGGGLAGGEIDDHQVICPRHGARFCLRTGKALTPPAYEPVRSYQTRVTDDGYVEVGSE